MGLSNNFKQFCTKVADDLKGAFHTNTKSQITGEGHDGFTFSKGDIVVAKITTQGDSPDLMVSVTVADVSSDPLINIVDVTVRDREGTEMPVSQSQIFDPKTTKTTAQVIPPYYPANNFHFFHSNKILSPDMFENN